MGREHKNKGLLLSFKAFIFCTGIFLIAIFIFPALSFSTAQRIEGLLSMDLEDLLNVEVTSAFKKPQNVKEVPAAIYVITSEDIRHSGATSIPELLRMVPGVNVAKIDNGNWAISIRGFNGLFSDKLLVLMDGRILYKTLFSGVFWDAQDTVLEDIDRIEVIRGPGASTWGTNAVNGVINIITKEASKTKGGLFSVTSGNQERFTGVARYGFKIGELGAARLYVKHFTRHQQKDHDGATAWDDWSMDRAGMRTDLSFGNSKVSIKGEIYTGEGTTKLSGFVRKRNRVVNLRPDIPISGGYIISDFSHDFSKNISLFLRFYYDRTERKYSGVGSETWSTMNFEFQNTLKPFEFMDFIWGGIYRNTWDELPMAHGMAFGAFFPIVRSDDLFSLFFQNEIRIFDEKLHLLAGVRLDHYNYSGLEVQPTFRALYAFSDKQDIWFSISRALRSPSRYNRDAIWIVDVPQMKVENSIPVTAFIGNEDFDSERLWAYEIGYRWQPKRNLTFDATAFANFYYDLFAVSGGSPFPHYGYMIFPIYPKNYGKGESFGLEFTTNFKPYRWWRMECSYSYIDSHFWIDKKYREQSNLIETNTDNPMHQLSFRVSMDICNNLEFDLWLKYLSNLRRMGIPSYLGLDLRLGWHIMPGLELSLVGKDLLDSYHPEFKDYFLHLVETEVPRSFYGRLTWHF